MTEFRDKTAIVTGGSRGIGAAISRAFADGGATSPPYTVPARKLPTGYAMKLPVPAARPSPCRAISASLPPPKMPSRK
ncbi:MAG: hypothetical protein M9908_08090 [Phyllobacteriaceae bacterium]|nr:hypothetical protein [Phyllobacteriaceae bacterium]